MGGSKPFWLGVLYGLVLALAATGLLLAVARRPAGVPVVLAELPTPAPVRVYVLGAVASPGVYPMPADAIVEDALAQAGGALPAADLAAVNLAAGVQSGDRIDVPLMPPTAEPTRRPSATPSPAPGEPAATLPAGGGPTPTGAPTARSGAAAPTASSGAGSASSPTGTININTATAAELDRLPKIGPSIAQRIVEYRDAHGPFARIEDLQRVKGIGPSTFAALKDLVTVGP